MSKIRSLPLGETGFYFWLNRLLMVRLPLMKRIFSLIIFLLLLLAACRPTQQVQQIRVSVVADGRERTFILPAPTTVEEFLRDPKVDIQLGELDTINPPLYSQITDGMRITIARVAEQNSCERSDIPFQQTTALNEGLKPGERKVVQAGQNGVLEICYRVTVVDGTPKDKVETNRTTITAPQDEIVYVGPEGEVEPVPVNGTLAYINNGNAWVIQGSSTNKHPVTTKGNLDGWVFTLSPDGKQLLFTQKSSGDTSDNSLNQLSLLTDLSQAATSIDLPVGNILNASWIPGQDNTISYSTVEPSDASPGWKALNDLWQMRIDPTTGASLNLKPILQKVTGGLYSWWGTRFLWSPDGTKVAWSQADGIGMVDLDKGDLDKALLNYAVWRPSGNWSWRATVSWSPDGSLLLTTVHGPPVGSELPENSPAFNVAVADVAGTFSANIVANTGIWSAPQFSPLISSPDSQFPQGYIAYLQARDPFNSINGEYDLVVADRDGSNAHKVFPPEGRSGLTAQESIYQNDEFAWSPDGRQIAVIYQGNLWIVDVASQVAHQLTLDGGESDPVWTR